MNLSSSPTGDAAPTSVHTLQRVLVVARWLCWAWMVGVVSFGHDALVHPVVAWIAVGVMLVVALVATHLARTDPELLRRPSLVAIEAVIALALAIADGWVFEPGHVFTTSQNLATEWPLIVATSVGVASGPLFAGAIGLLFGPARLLSAALNDFSQFGRKHLGTTYATSSASCTSHGEPTWSGTQFGTGSTDQAAERQRRCGVFRGTHVGAKHSTRFSRRRATLGVAR